MDDAWAQINPKSKIENRKLLATITAVIVGLMLAPLAADAQQAGKVWRIGFLGPPPSTEGHLIRAFQQGLRELGYVEGQNITIEYRSSEGKDERLPPARTRLSNEAHFGFSILDWLPTSKPSLLLPQA